MYLHLDGTKFPYRVWTCMTTILKSRTMLFLCFLIQIRLGAVICPTDCTDCVYLPMTYTSLIRLKKVVSKRLKRLKMTRVYFGVLHPG